MSRFLAFCALVCALGCSSDPLPLRDCTPGATLACACVGGAQGAQVCSAAGTLGACVCPMADAMSPTEGDASRPDAATDAPPTDALPDAPADAVDGADAPTDAPVDVAPDAPDGGCPAGFADCDGNASNGCEVDVRSNVNHCAACSRACVLTATASARCVASRCEVVTCLRGYGDCDGNAANGCETDFSATGSCGVCGMVCASRPNASMQCVELRCSYACDAGWSDCDGSPANGCETHAARCP